MEPEVGAGGYEWDEPPRKGDDYDQHFGYPAQERQRCLPAALRDSSRVPRSSQWSCGRFHRRQAERKRDGCHVGAALQIGLPTLDPNGRIVVGREGQHLSPVLASDTGSGAYLVWVQADSLSVRLE